MGQKASITVLSSDAIDIREGKGFYINNDEGKRTEIAFPLPIERIDVSFLHDVERVGRNGALVAVLDSYGSRGGGERCTGKIETWLRIFSIVESRQLEAIPVASCVENLTPGDPPVTWRDDGFDVHGSKPTKYRIANGRIERIGDQKTK